MLKFILVISLVLNFTSAYANDPSVRRLRFQNNGSAIAVDDCSETKCRHIVTLTPELTRLLRKTISTTDISQVPLSLEDEATIKTYGRAWKLGATSIGLLAALFTLPLNPVFARGIWNGRATGWGAALLHFGLIGYGGYKFGEWISNPQSLTVRASRREKSARAFDQLMAEVHSQIPPGRSRFVDIPEWLAQQLDLNSEPQFGALSNP